MTRKTGKKRNKKRSLMMRRVRFLLLIAVLALCICLFTPLFHTKTVVVTGNDTISAEQILEQADIPLNENIFKLSKRAVRRRVLTMPEIETVRIRRILPSKIRLEVTETYHTLYFPYMTGCVVTNEKGRTMALYDNTTFLDLLKITGLEIKNAEICEKITVQDTVKFDIILDTVAALQEKGLLDEFSACHFDNLSDFHGYLKDGTKIIFGDTSDLAYKLSVLSTVLGQVNRTEGAYVDVSTPQRTVYGMLPPEPVQEEGEEETAPEADQPETQESETTASPETADPAQTEKPAEKQDSEQTKQDSNEGTS